jgi:hypothetical protein
MAPASLSVITMAKAVQRMTASAVNIKFTYTAGERFKRFLTLHMRVKGKIATPRIEVKPNAKFEFFSNL